MSIVSVHDLEKSFAATRLFSGVTFALGRRDHVVLVGRNGAGKTTLLRLLAGVERPDRGTVSRARGARVWLHEQTPELQGDRPLRDYLREAFADLVALERELDRLEADLSGLREDDPALPAAMRRYQQVQRRFEAAGGYDPRDRLAPVFAGLGLDPALLDRPLRSLSGGELTRATLARALLADADLLLLDEPTNHLDLDSVEWLEGFLATSPRAFVLVTHDRRLLERVGERVLAIEHGTVTVQGGDFATWQREREARRDLLRRRHEQDLAKIAQLQRFYDRFHAKKDKARQAKAKLTQIERLRAGLQPPPAADPATRLRLPQPRPSARVVVEAVLPVLRAGGGDGRVLARDLSFVLERGEKVALVGANGSGKTTLLETVAGRRGQPGGAVHLGHNVVAAWYSQHGRELDGEATLLDTVLPLVGHDEERARGLLGRFRFGADEAGRRVATLSGGERSRLRLLRLLVGGANLLLLDEPTNHLDMDAVDALTEALAEYTGTLLLVTHDRHLIDRVAQRVLELHDGRLLNHLSPQRYWEARAARAGGVSAAGARPPGPAGSGRAPAGGRGGDGDGGGGRGAPGQGPARPARRAPEEARRRRAALRAAEAAILRLETRLGEIDQALFEPATYADRAAVAALVREREELSRRLDEEYAAWERLVDEAG